MQTLLLLCFVSVASAEYVDEPIRPGKGAHLPKSYPERPQQYVANDARSPPQSDSASESSEEDDEEFDDSPLSDAAKPKAAPKPVATQPRPAPKPEPRPAVSNTGVRVSKTNQGLKQNQIDIVRGGNTRNVVNAPNTVNIDLRYLQKTNQNNEQGSAQVAPQNDAAANPYRRW
ncbi:hypothetical protein ANCCAN_05903 [Ancylostoma caninum]|uniref:Uncharacterized protein n=1 Tax=Ancylostoma caninum TaxID=29170 RepID=A0A368GYL3_ANCCA|nr:hypothetical protein ANCCAN_05903 [Ancylostoma caninum]